jgi:DNA-binding CsgD family transcriptional regulator
MESLAADSGISTSTAKVWLAYFRNAGIAEGFGLKIDALSPTPDTKPRLWQMAETLKLLKMQPLTAGELAHLLNCSESVAGTLLRNLISVGVVDSSTGMLASRLSVHKTTAPWAERLSATQMTTLRILARTGSIKATANERHVSEHTVASMLKDIYVRMGVHSSTTAAYMLGLLDGANAS